MNEMTAFHMQVSSCETFDLYMKDDFVELVTVGSCRKRGFISCFAVVTFLNIQRKVVLSG